MSTTTTPSAPYLVAGEPVTMTAHLTKSNPFMDDPSGRMTHWRCCLTFQGRQYRVTFSKGEGHHGAPPTVAEIMECLALDAGGWENAANFEDWCGEYGYDTDSRRAERTYRAVEKVRLGLKHLLGEHYDAVIWPDVTEG